jgi:succinate-semialdehyde dehydrogenase/glutarate-semialdehyde dehydrogenase
MRFDNIAYTCHKIRRAIGVIACIIPFNFPPALWWFKVAAALAAGNAVVVKAPIWNPLSIVKLHEIMVEVGIPPEVAQLITGGGSEVGGVLVSDPRIASVNFTGSTATGISIAKSAPAWRLTKRYASIRIGTMFSRSATFLLSNRGYMATNSGLACASSMTIW